MWSRGEGRADCSRPAVPGRAYARKGRKPYYAPNPLCGGASSFAKASEDLSKGARGGPRRGSGQAGSFEVGSLGRGGISEAA